MKFDEVLPEIMEGKRARRQLWVELGGKCGSWVELVSGAKAGDRDIVDAIMVWMADDKTLLPWGGANRDVLATDWQVLDG